MLDIGEIEPPLLLFGGPYSNLTATRAIQRQADALRIPPERVICTGDIVAYCASPQETVQSIRDWGIYCVMGNCEESLAQRADDCGCGFEEGTSCALLSDQWFPFADSLVDADARRWMGTLPAAVGFRIGPLSFLVVHGAPSSINRFVFLSTQESEKAAELDLAGTKVIIGGHCGLPFGQRVDERYWLNSGVIGLPANDGTRDGWYLLLSEEALGLRATWHRLTYAYDEAFEAMQRAGLDNGYATALRSGIWPSMDVLPEAERAQQSLELRPRALWLG